MVRLTTLSTQQWVLLIVGLIVCAGVGFFAIATYTSSTHTPAPVQYLNSTTNQTPEHAPANTTIVSTSTPQPTPTIPYKIIPRNTTDPLVIRKPLMEPTIDLKHNYTISINPPFNTLEINTPDIGIHRGTIFEVTGHTDLPVGARLVVQVSPGRGGPSQKRPDSCSLNTIYNGTCPNAFDLMGTIYVEPGCTGAKNCTTVLNTWRFIVDSQPLLPDEYIVKLDSTPDVPCHPAYTLIAILEDCK